MNPPSDNLPAKPKRLKRSYTEEQVERGLAEVVIAGGNTRLASSRLEDSGVEIPHQTLAYWTHSKAEQFQAIRARLLPKIRETIAQQSENLAIEYGHAEVQVLELLRGQLAHVPAKELAGVASRLAVAKGIAFDKARVSRDMPTHIVENRTGEEIIDALAAKHPHLAAPIDGTAEEIEDAQLVA